MTSAHLRSQDITSLDLVHSSSTLSHSSVTVVGFLAITLSPRIFQRFWIGFRSGLWPGHFIISMFLASRNCFTCFAVWQGHCLAWKLQADWEMLAGKMLLKEVLISICIHPAMFCSCKWFPNPTAKNIPQTMTLPPPPFTDYFTHSGFSLSPVW